MLEHCEDGYPHFHLLARSNFIPQERLKELWEKLTGAYIVDIRKAHGRSTGYIAKYIQKARNSNGSWSRQRMSVSKRFWRKEDRSSTHIGFTHSRMHPIGTAEERPGCTFERLRPGYYHPRERQPGDEQPWELMDPRQLLQSS